MGPGAIAKLHHRKPNLKIGLKVNNSPGLIDAVIMQQLDLAVVNVYRRPDTLHVLYEKKLHYVCLLPEKHALAQSVTPIDLEMIKDVQHVAYDRARLQIAQPNWLQLLSWPQADLSAYSNIAVASLARATGKLAIVDPYTAKTVSTWTPLRKHGSRCGLLLGGQNTTAVWTITAIFVKREEKIVCRW